MNDFNDNIPDNDKDGISGEPNEQATNDGGNTGAGGGFENPAGPSNESNGEYYSQVNNQGGNVGGAQQGDYNPYGGNAQYKWNYDDYQKAIENNKKPPKKNKGLKVFVICVCTVFGVALISLASVGIMALSRDHLASSSATSSATSSTNGVNPNGPSLKTNDKPSSAASTSSAVSTTPLQMSTEQVYNAVKNSVVTIEVYDAQSVDPSAEGSGIVESANGYIITNEHVIDGASSVEVVLANGKQYGATIVGSDLRTDLSVLKINETGLTPATFGNSDQINVAEPVLAIGNPGGIEFSGSVTEGIVSALNRDITTENGYSESCIQTDAPINPGNSGGALVNMYGQVIGITSSKIEATGYEGMGFAIPINTAQPVINDIIHYGYVTGRVKIGISVAEYDSYRAQAMGYPMGLMVEAVDSTSDAAAKGIKVNDIITKINGVAITTYDQFYAEEIKYKAGDSVTLTVFRPSTKATTQISVKLAEDKGDQTAPAATQQNTYGFGNSNGNGSTTTPFGG